MRRREEPRRAGAGRGWWWTGWRGGGQSVAAAASSLMAARAEDSESGTNRGRQACRQREGRRGLLLGCRAGVWSKSSRCAGHPAVPTCYCRSAPACSMTSSSATSAAGTPASARPLIPYHLRRSLPQFVPLSFRLRAGQTEGGKLVVSVRAAGGCSWGVGLGYGQKAADALGHPAVPTCYCRSAPACSMTSSSATSAAGTPASARPLIPYHLRRSLPQFVPLSFRLHDVRYVPFLFSLKMACLADPVMTDMMKCPVRPLPYGLSGISPSSLRHPAQTSRSSCQRAGHRASPGHDQIIDACRRRKTTLHSRGPTPGSVARRQSQRKCQSAAPGVGHRHDR